MAINQLDKLELGVQFKEVVKANKQLVRLHSNMEKIVQLTDKVKSTTGAYEVQRAKIDEVSRSTNRMTDFVKANAKVNSKVTADRKRQLNELRRQQRQQFAELKRQYREEQALEKRNTQNAIRERKKLDRERQRLENKRSREAKKKADERLQLEKRIGAAILASVTAVGAVVAKQAIQANELFEQSRINLETLSGSVEKGNALFKELVELTLETPFKLDETLTGAKRLLAMGVEAEKVASTLENLGNIAAGVGREKLPQLILAFGQVRTATRLTGQELRQFQEAGVPLLDLLAQRSEKTASEIKESMGRGVAPSFKDVEQAIIDATTAGGKFADLMKRQSATLAGEVSKLQDAWTVFLNTTTSKFQDSIKSMVKSVRELLDELGQESKLEGDRKRAREIGELRNIITDAGAGLNVRVLAFEKLKQIAPELSNEFNAIEQFLKSSTLLSISQSEELDKQVKSLKAKIELGNVEYKIAQKTKRLEELRADQRKRELGAELFKRGVNVGKDRLPLVHDAGKQQKEIDELISALQHLRRLRDAINKGIPEGESKPDKPVEVIQDTPKALKQMAEQFRAIDLETAQGVKTFESAYEQKAKIIEKFIEQSGVEAKKLNELFSGQLTTGKINKADSKALTKGLSDASNVSFQEDEGLNLSDAEKLAFKNNDERLKAEARRYKEYLNTLREFDIGRFASETELAQARLEAFDAFLKEQTRMTKREAEIRKRLEADVVRSNLSMWSSNLNKFGSIMGSFADISGEASEESFNNSKALNYGMAVMSTAAGVMNALANNPDPISKWIDVAAVVATGAAQVAAISATTFKGKGSVEEVQTAPVTLSKSFGAEAGENQDIIDRFRAIQDATGQDDDGIGSLTEETTKSNKILKDILEAVESNGRS